MGIADFAILCWVRRISAAIKPRAAPAQALAALNHALRKGFFFVSDLIVR